MHSGDTVGMHIFFVLGLERALNYEIPINNID